MDSQGFLQLVRNFTSLTEEEFQQLSRQSAQFPYSQLLHLLNARAAHDLHKSNAPEILHTSATYSTDRSVLKWVMTAPARERISHLTILAKEDRSGDKISERNYLVTPEAPLRAMPELLPVIREKKPEAVDEVITKPTVNLSGDELRNDLQRELKRLQELKHQFEVSLDEFQKFNTEDVEARRQSKVPMEADPLLAEIKSTKKKLKVENPKQKEQNEIIDQFIKTKPVIPKVRPTAPSTDLSEESSIFSDNIVSETLVELLLKQGKKEKAIEVLKKLIWKFPQKKAYFAAQIEDLKN